MRDRGLDDHRQVGEADRLRAMSMSEFPVSMMTGRSG
jgi:hypothetical protein